MVIEKCFIEEDGNSSQSCRLLGEVCKSLAISLIDAEGNDDNTLGVRGVG